MDLSFVSSADQLIEQFKRVRTDEAVNYELWMPVRANGAEETREKQASQLCDAILQFVKQRTAEYLWEFDDFNLHIQENVITSDFFGLSGRTRYGENIEDEWLIVWLLFEISAEYPELIVQVVDDDGQFLLIEAAQYLPRWVRPENTEHRVWIKNRQLHVISPNAEQLRQHKKGKGLPGLQLSEALHLVSSSNQHVASANIQAAIQQRISQFPEQISSSMHHCACILPFPIAKILDTLPQAVSLSVRALNDRKPEQVTSFAKKPYKNERFLALKVKISKWQYAQLMFHQMYPPKGYSNAASTAFGSDVHAVKATELGAKLTAGFDILLQQHNDNNNNAAEGADNHWQSFLESLKAKNFFEGSMEGSRLYNTKLSEARRFFAEQKQSKHTNISMADAILQEMCFTYHHISELSEEISSEIKDVNELESANEDDSWMYAAPSDFEAEMQRIANKMASDLKISGHYEQDPAIMNKDLDALSNIVNGFTSFMTSSSGIEGAEITTPSSSKTLPATAAAQAVDFSTFDAKIFEDTLQSVGYRIEKETLVRETNGSNDNEEGEGEGGEEEEADDYFSDYDYDDDNDAEEEEEEDTVETKDVANLNNTTRHVHFAEDTQGEHKQQVHVQKSLGTGVGFIADNDNDQAGDEDDDSVEDSDDEVMKDSDDEEEGQVLLHNNDNSDEDDEAFMAEYMAAMDAQLRGTTLEQSFEQFTSQRTNKVGLKAPPHTDNNNDNDDEEEMPVDIDANLIKYLLESVNAQMGAAGPASNLLRELGLDIPLASAVEVELDEES